MSSNLIPYIIIEARPGSYLPSIRYTKGIIEEYKVKNYLFRLLIQFIQEETAFANIDTIEKVNSDKGSIVLLINDPKLYNNLSATSNKLNLLLDDVRVHPKRYINVSVFGKKEKNKPLTAPLPDTINAPYTK